MNLVNCRSYELHDATGEDRPWIATGPYAPAAERTPEAERLRLLLDFSRAAVHRLVDYHDQNM